VTNAKWHAQHRIPPNANLKQRVAWHLAHAKHCACRPIPPRLATLIQTNLPIRRKESQSIRMLLTGGDRRSIAQSNRVLAIVRGKRRQVSELVALAKDDDWLVSMRAMDLLEKLVHEHPEWVAPYKRVFIGELADTDKWEVRLQIVRALPLFDWTPNERRRVVEILRRDVAHPQKFVKVWAVDSLATLSQHDTSLRPLVLRCVQEFEQSGSKALASRARHVRRRLAF
jgi:hypothetical protein